MNKTELQAAIAEHNRIIDMFAFELENIPDRNHYGPMQDMADAITNSFFEAYADSLSDFPDIVDTIKNLKADSSD